MFELWGRLSEFTLAAWSWVSDQVVKQQSAWAFLGSTALVGGAGAYFGALGAQRSMLRENRLSKRREAIAAVNAAHSITNVILNQAAGVKKQHYLPTLEEWERQRQLVVEKRERCVAIHLQTPPPIHFPITQLADLIYAKLTLNGRPISALAELVQAEFTLSSLVDAHEALRQEFGGKPPEYVVPRYLALETEQGQDARYQDICRGLIHAIDDLLFFSDVLGRDLLEHGDAVRNKATKRERRSLPSLNSHAKVLAGNEYLIPKHEHHQKWYDNHVMIKEPSKSLWRSFWPF